MVDAVGAGGLVGIEGELEGGLSGVFAAGAEVEPEGVLFGIDGEGAFEGITSAVPDFLLEEEEAGLFPDGGVGGCELCGLFVEPSGLAPTEHAFVALGLLEGVECELSASAGESHQSAALLEGGSGDIAGADASDGGGPPQDATCAAWSEAKDIAASGGMPQFASVVVGGEYGAWGGLGRERFGGSADGSGRSRSSGRSGRRGSSGRYSVGGVLGFGGGLCGIGFVFGVGLGFLCIEASFFAGSVGVADGFLGLGEAHPSIGFVGKD